MAKVLIETYGCTLNQSDSSIMESLLLDRGMEVEQAHARSFSGYDYVVVNTCTVKKVTEQRILHRLSEARKSGKRLIVTGCMASANADIIKRVAPEAGIVTTSNIASIGNAIEDMRNGKRASYDRFSITDKAYYLNPNKSVIAKIPLSEGCMSSCSFCETKFARGPLNSFSDELILKALKTSVGRGAKEIEFTAQDVGAYGLDRKTNIAELVKQAADIGGEFRIRIGMLNPEHLHRYFDDLLEALQMRNVFKFIHMPVQSASNAVLAHMKRRYTIEEFNSYVRELRSKIPNISIATDIIVGYPTETDDDFRMSIDFVKEIRPSVTNVSKFAIRPHAEAAMLEQLPNSAIKLRSTEMARVARAVQKEDLSKLLGLKETILLTGSNDRSFTGRDDYYRTIAVRATATNLGIGSFVEAELVDNSSVCLFAEHKHF